MATIYGTCGAWKSVLQLAGLEPAACDGPKQLAAMVVKWRQERAIWRQRAQIEVQVRIARMRLEIPRLEVEHRLEIDRVTREVSPKVDDVRRKIAACEGARFFIKRWYFRWMHVPGLRLYLRTLETKLASAGKSEADKLHATKRELARVEADPEPDIRRLIAPQEAMLARAVQAMASPKHAGAEAELEMAKTLARRLSDAYHVFHDVRVEADRWKFDGKEHRRSAQIDHVVVGPGGVFVLEDKRWSKKFSEKGDYYDPFRQVNWSAKLLRDAIREHIGENIRVREILVSRGKLPSQPESSYAKIKCPEAVCGYIQWFKPELDTATLNAVVEVMRRMC